MAYTPRSIKECPLYEYPLFFGPNEASTIQVLNFDIDQITGSMAFTGVISGASILNGNLGGELTALNNRGLVWLTDSDAEL